ncbi:MAG: CCA tRNA nucleotidyltransferase [Hyphomonadaceae bacterium]
MSVSIAHAAWLKSAETRAVIAALEAARPGGSRFVGGCVRNALMTLDADDIDIATVLTPDETMAAAKAAGLVAVPTGVEHGTVTIVSNHKPYEVTTLRRDVETDGRHAIVQFTDDWQADAERRDFRLNALYADPAGNVFDPTEGGVADAKAGRVIFIGEADARIKEDYLRILRFFRFSAWYGKGALDGEGLAACARHLSGLDGLSVERIWKETKKLFAAEEPTQALTAMEVNGVRAHALGELSEMARALKVIAIENEFFLARDPLQRIAAALPDETTAQRFAQRMKASNEEAARLRAAHKPADRIVSYMSVREIRRALYRLGRDAFEDRVKIAWAEDEKRGNAPQWRALLMHAEVYQRPKLPLTGEEVMAAGVPAGPKVGRVLREVEDWWIDADFPDDKLSIVERLKAVAQGLA